jgi:hypothetical protein
MQCLFSEVETAFLSIFQVLFMHLSVEVFSSPQLRIPHDPPIPSPLICHVDNA